jgi:hypothetical protein
MRSISNYLSAAIVVSATLLVVPSAYAGDDIIKGASVESSGSGTFQPPEVKTEVAPNTNIDFDGTTFGVSSETLKEFDKIASDIREEFQDKNNVVIDLMLGSKDAGVAGLQFKTALVELGANSDTVDKLKSALSDLLPDCQSLSIPTCKSIDIKKLNEVITAHNQLVQTSSPQTLVKISQHSYFKDLFVQLTQLRQALRLK